MLEKVKRALRVSTNLLDDELLDLIGACKIDLSIAGIEAFNEEDPLIIRAVINYARANFGYSEEQDRFQRTYNSLKCSMQLSSKYKN